MQNWILPKNALKKTFDRNQVIRSVCIFHSHLRVAALHNTGDRFGFTTGTFALRDQESPTSCPKGIHLVVGSPFWNMLYLPIEIIILRSDAKIMFCGPCVDAEVGWNFFLEPPARDGLTRWLVTADAFEIETQHIYMWKMFALCHLSFLCPKKCPSKPASPTSWMVED